MTNKMTKTQKEALKNIKHGYNWVVGGIENSVTDGGMEQLPSIEEMFQNVYDEVTSCTFGEGFCDSKGEPNCMKLAGEAFVLEQIAKAFKADGYEVPDELTKAPKSKSGHSNLVDGERINLHYDEVKEVILKAFTGMVIGEFKISKQTKTTVSLKTAKGELKFDKASGKQTNADNPKYANRIEVL